MRLLEWLTGKRPPGNPALEPLMIMLARGGDRRNWKKFFERLVAGCLIVPSPGAEPIGHTDGAQIHLMVRDAPDGSSGLIVFTSEDALRAWRQVGCPYFDMPSLKAIKLAVQAKQGSLLINPESPSGIFLRRRDLLMLLGNTNPIDAVSRRRIEKDARLVVAAAPTVPEPLKAAVTNAASRCKSVRAAWIAEIVLGEGGPRLCVVLERSQRSNEDEILRAVMHDIQPAIGNGEYLDFLSYPTGAGALEDVRVATPALFERRMDT